MVGRGFAGGVRGIGGVGSVFVEGGVGGGEGAVDLVGGDVEEAELFALAFGERLVVLARCLQEGESPVDVGVEEGLGSCDGAVDVGFGGEVDDGGGLVPSKEAGDEVGVADVAVDEGVEGIVLDGCEVFRIAGVGELV